MNNYKDTLTEVLKSAGVEINGKNPWDIQVHNDKFYALALTHGTLGLGEAYMDGWWDSENLDELVFRLLRADIRKHLKLTPLVVWIGLKSLVLNLQSRIGSKKVAHQHYDLSPELYSSFLDPYKQYSCGYFKDTTDLNTAQEKKLKLICDKLQLKSGDKVLDIGCGWGGFAKYAAEKYGCEVTGITISEQQVQYAQNYTQGLKVKILNLDYRDISSLNQQFDKIVSVGMMEHVGHKNYRRLMEIVNKNLTEDGLFLLHTIGNKQTTIRTDLWLDKYIFPNHLLPSAAQLSRAMENLFIMEDWHNFGAYYDLTLMAWHANFKKNWDKIKNQYDERFYRMWTYYLQTCAGSFRTREIELWQIVLSKKGVLGGYQSIR